LIEILEKPAIFPRHRFERERASTSFVPAVEVAVSPRHTELHLGWRQRREDGATVGEHDPVTRPCPLA
jgi:hypothetical protein